MKNKRVIQALMILNFWYENAPKFNPQQALYFKARGLVGHDRWLTGRDGSL